MRRLLRSGVRSFLILLVCAAFADPARAQTQKPSEESTLQSLLNEVRLLRETLQQINLNSYRSQIVVERMRAQNERVARTTRMLEDVREQTADLQSQARQLNERAKAIESELQQEADSKRRAQMELESRELKYALDHQKQMLERLQERELRLTVELNTEQDRLRDLENRLETLEREIENEIERQRAAGRRKGH